MGTPRPATPAQLLDQAEHRLHNASRILPNVLDTLDERRAQAGTRTTNETGRTSRGINDPTARLGLELAWIAHQRQDITNAIRLIHQALDHLDQRLRATFSHHTPDQDPPQCTGWPIGKTCYDSPGYDFDRSGKPITRANRLCDMCEMERKAEERREADAHRKRLARQC